MNPTIIVDIDGTVANHENIRGHHEYELVSKDTPHLDVIDLVSLLADGRNVVFVSGRPERCREDTEAWLRLHMPFLDSFELFMRTTGDFRADNIVKKELFDAHIDGRFDIDFVIDDRDRVVKMWRSLGLRVLQVADGDF